ncbi:MAG: PHP domain-containing protein, partial [Desulfosarcina sp.]|nr:PHP domain-containing protein [Desulfobacterales bacterium]
MDLHIHSTASDGTLTPAEILTRAHHLGLSAIALTDHDTLKGVADVMAAGIPSGLHFMSGVEISTAAPEH